MTLLKKISIPAISFLLLWSCQKKPQEFADTVYVNAKIFTVDKSNPWAEAMAVKKGKFIYVGKSNGIDDYKGPNTQVVDLKGQLMLPGLIDDHIHPDMGADNYLNVFINASDTWEDVTALSRKRPLVTFNYSPYVTNIIVASFNHEQKIQIH